MISCYRPINAIPFELVCTNFEANFGWGCVIWCPFFERTNGIWSIAIRMHRPVFAFWLRRITIITEQRELLLSYSFLSLFISTTHFFFYTYFCCCCYKPQSSRPTNCVHRSRAVIMHNTQNKLHRIQNETKKTKTNKKRRNQSRK